MTAPVTEGQVEGILSDPAASNWLKSAIQESLERDPVDALNDALALAGVLEDRLRQVLELGDFV